MRQCMVFAVYSVIGEILINYTPAHQNCYSVHTLHINTFKIGSFLPVEADLCINTNNVFTRRETIPNLTLEVTVFKRF